MSETIEFKLPPLQKAHIEQVLFRVADRTIVGYTGGQWKFHKKAQLFYLPSKEVVKANAAFNEVKTTTKAASIACSIIAANQLCWKAYEDGAESASRFWHDAFHWYKEAVFGYDNLLDLSEPERGEIYQIID